MTSTVICTQTDCTKSEQPSTLTVAAAREQILASSKAVEGREQLSLRDSLGRILADDVIAPMNVPEHVNSAMDGYALAGEELPADDSRSYQIVGTAYAGSTFEGHCHPGDCVRIMTGAPMPDGTDSVVMQEQVKVESEQRITIGSGHHRGQNVRLAGEDIAIGSSVLNRGRRVTPADIGVLASLGIGEISVQRRPRVAFFSTGDELRSIGEPRGKGEIYDSNRYSLYGMLKQQDVELLDMGVVRDTPEALRRAFQSAAAVADMVLSSGGVSVGEADYTKSILSEIGQIQFWKIAMKPGRPLTFGHLGDALFFGLPGNPVAVMVTFYQFVLPALRKLAGGERYNPLTVQAVCKQGIRKRKGRYEFVRGIMQQETNGDISVTSVGHQGSGILTSMSRGNCFILLPESCGDLNAGDTVQVQPFACLF